MKRRLSGGLRGMLGACMLGLALLSGTAYAAQDDGALAPSVQARAAAPAMPGHAYLDGTPRVAIISAFAPELALLRKELSQPREHQVNGVAFTTGTLRGHSVLLFLSGMSMVNAAMNTQLALDRFAVSHILFSGIAGGVNPDLNIGDVNVPERWGQHLEVLMAREIGPDKYAVFPAEENMGMSNFGMLHHRAVGVASDASAQPRPQFWFPVDRELLELARGVQDLALESCDHNQVCLRERPRLVVGGNGLSGSAFVDNAQYREHLSRVFRANVVEMESAACAMVAQANQVPFLAFRSVSDLAGGGPGSNEMYTFLNLAAENSARVLMVFLEHWRRARPGVLATVQ